MDQFDKDFQKEKQYWDNKVIKMQEWERKWARRFLIFILFFTLAVIMVLSILK